MVIAETSFVQTSKREVDLSDAKGVNKKNGSKTHSENHDGILRTVKSMAVKLTTIFET